MYFFSYHVWFFGRYHCDKSHRENYVRVSNIYRVHVKVVARSPIRNGSTSDFSFLRNARWNRLRSLRTTRREFLLQRQKSFRLHNKRVLRNRKRSNRVRVLAYRCAHVMLLISIGRVGGVGSMSNRYTNYTFIDRTMMDSSNELKRVACCTKIIENRSKCSGANGDFSTTHVLSKNIFTLSPSSPTNP